MLLLYALVGLVVGSFLNVVIDRVPVGASLLRPPSHCGGCGRRLAWHELAPVLSYVVLRGRCRTCGARIPVRVLVVELVTGLAFALLWHVYGPSGALPLMTLHTCVLLTVFVIDLEHRIVPNVIIVPALIYALGAALAQALVMPPLYAHYGLLALLPIGGSGGGWSLAHLSGLSLLLGGVIAFAVFFAIWWLVPGGMGAGDVKLAAFCGLITGVPMALGAVMGSFILGGLAGATLLLSGTVQRKTAIPFAPFLVIATFVAMTYGNEIVAWYLAR